MRNRTAMAVVFAAALATPALAQEGAPVGTLLYAQGEASLVRNLKTVPMLPNTPIHTNDTVRAPIGARVKMALDDDSVLMVWDDAEVRLQTAVIDVVQSRRVLELELVAGNLRLVGAEFLGVQSRILVTTPSAKIAMDEGGDVLIRHRPQSDQTEVVVMAGRIEMQHVFADYAGKVTLEAQQTAAASAEGAPSTPVLMDRDSYDTLQRELWWVLPEAIPDWDAAFSQRLADLGAMSFGRVRRAAAKPLLPIRVTTEGLSDQGLVDRPGTMLPKPSGTLELDWTYDLQGEGDE